MQIIDIIDRVSDGGGRDGKDPERDWEKCQGIMVHRVGVDLKSGGFIGHDAETICDAFTGGMPEVAKYTGGENAYTLFVGGDTGPAELDGLIWQALPLSEVGFHGRRWSVPYIGIACIGDFRVQPPSATQLNNLVDLCAALCAAFLWDPYKQIVGHDEVKGASSDPNKECPGKLLAMNPLRDDVATILKDQARSKLYADGLTFGRRAA